jgi:hypothetical protein
MYGIIEVPGTVLVLVEVLRSTVLLLVLVLVLVLPVVPVQVVLVVVMSEAPERR